MSWFESTVFIRRPFSFDLILSFAADSILVALSSRFFFLVLSSPLLLLQPSFIRLVRRLDLITMHREVCAAH